MKSIHDLETPATARIPLSILIGLLASVAAAGGAWFVLADHVSVNTNAIRLLRVEDQMIRADLASTREILVRIDENVKVLKIAR